MRQKSGPVETAEQHVRDIRRATRRRYSAEDKIRIVLSGLRGEHAIASGPPFSDRVVRNMTTSLFIARRA